MRKITILSVFLLASCAGNNFTDTYHKDGYVSQREFRQDWGDCGGYSAPHDQFNACMKTKGYNVPEDNKQPMSAPNK
jgi:hypothetical protein